MRVEPVGAQNIRALAVLRVGRIQCPCSRKPALKLVLGMGRMWLTGELNHQLVTFSLLFC